jgi:hypothetical protein
MTMSPGAPGPTDFEGKAVPPYEGRQEGADVDEESKLRRDGADVGVDRNPVRRRSAPGTSRARGVARTSARARTAATTPPSGTSGDR